MPVFTATGPISAHVRVPGGSCTITATESPDVSVTLTPAVPLLAGDRHAVAATAVSFEGGRLRVEASAAGSVHPAAAPAPAPAAGPASPARTTAAAAPAAAAPVAASEHV